MPFAATSENLNEKHYAAMMADPVKYKLYREVNSLVLTYENVKSKKFSALPYVHLFIGCRESCPGQDVNKTYKPCALSI